MHTQTTRARLRALSLSIAAAIWVAGNSALAVPVLLYDMDFNGPPHVIGNQPATDIGPAPRKGPSEIVFGDPRVVSGVGAMASPCVRLDAIGSDTYEQIGFGLTDDFDSLGFHTRYPGYRAEMDVILTSLPRTLKIFADADTGAHALIFNSDSKLLARTLSGAGYEQQIGTYDLNRVYRVRIDTNLVQHTWQIYLDGNRLLTGAYPSLSSQRLFRVSLSPWAGTVVGLDNVRIYGLPEPALMAPVAFTFFVLRRKRA